MDIHESAIEALRADLNWVRDNCASLPTIKARVDRAISTLGHLTTRLSEVERERDEARAEVERWKALHDENSKTFDAVRSERDELHTDWGNVNTALTQARADLATLRAAVDEAVDALKAYDDATPEHGDDCRVGPYYHCTCDLRVAHEKARELRGRLRNLTKPDTPSERIMSDKDRENPVEGAHPTQPEGEDALAEEKLLAELALLYNHKDDDSRQFTRWQMIVAIRHGMSLASRGLVRGEGVER